MSLFVKDPDSRIDYRVDWGEAYLGENLITASQWHVTPQEEGGLAVAASGHDGLGALATLTGGRTGGTYALTNRVTLTNGAIDERSVAIRVEQR